jgi:O-antigen/teichoic acid export membrane protein
MRAPEVQTQAPSLEVRESLLARNTVLNFLGLIIPVVVGVLTVPIIIHYLGTERYGIFSLVLAVFGYFSIFDLGLGRATTKFIAEALGRGEIQNIPKYLWTTVAFQGVLGVCGAVLLILLTPVLVGRIIHIPPQNIAEAKMTFYILAVSLPFVIVTPSFRGVLEAAQRFDLVNAIKIPTNVLIFILPLVGVLLGYGLNGIMVLVNISRILALLVWIVICFKVYPVLRKRIFLEKGKLKPLLSFGGWNTLSSVIWPFLVSFDRFLIGAVRNVEAVSFYAAPNDAVMRLGVIPGSMSLTLFPAFSSLEGSRQKERIRYLFRRSLKFTILGLGAVIVFMIFFARMILKIWLGEKFAVNSTLVFQILAAGYLLTALANVPYSYLQGIGRADLTTKFQFLEFLFYIPMLWMLTTVWGINGAALAWAIRVAVDMLLHFEATRRLGKLGLLELIKSENFKAWLTISGLAAGTFLSLHLPWRFIWLVVAGCGFIYTSWFWVLGETERQWLGRPLRRFSLDKWLARIPNIFIRPSRFL